MDALKNIVQLAVYFEKRSICASHISMVYSRLLKQTGVLGEQFDVLILTLVSTPP